VASRLDTAEAAFAAFEVEAFTEAMDDAALTVPCLEDVVAPSLAARYHRLVGLDSFVGREEARAERAFAAARSIEPGATLPVTLVPEGHEVHALFSRYDLGAWRSDTLPPPAAGAIVLDGTPGRERPVDWPVLLQIVDGDESVALSAYLFPGDAVPAYPVDPAWLRREARRKRTRVALYGTAIGAAVASGFVYGLAAASASSFHEDHPDWTTHDLEAQRARTNALVGASAGLAGIAVGTGAAGLLLPGGDRR
jgi:hypothetical protein